MKQRDRETYAELQRDRDRETMKQRQRDRAAEWEAQHMRNMRKDDRDKTNSLGRPKARIGERKTASQTDRQADKLRKEGQRERRKNINHEKARSECE